MGKSKKKSKENSLDADAADKGADDKPLPRLVLKVGKEKKIRSETPEGSESEHSHYKKKKKKHKHKIEESTEKKSKKREAVEASELEPPVKRIHMRASKEKDKKQEQKEISVNPLNLCLENMHRNLQRKDVYGIFTFPVTDLIAPGYSKIIKVPMDFNTMSKKIENNIYTCIEQFKQDYIVMCNNAMLYNGSDTIYYKSAEKMLGIGIKMLSKEKIKKMNKSVGLVISDDEDDVVHVDDSSDINIDSVSEEMYSPKKRTPDKKRKETSKYQSAITASILAVAREARQKLMKKHPNQHYGYLSKDDKGNTSLNILNPDTTEENKSVPVNLGELAGKLQTGIPAGQIIYQENKKNKAIPVQYLLYGPYGSFGPTYDSSLSNLSKEESSVLLRTYGTEAGIAYAKSLLCFTKDSPLAKDYVERILDTVTGGSHSKLTKMTKPKEVQVVKAATVPSKDTVATDRITTLNQSEQEKTSDNVKVDVDSLMTLDGLGIDISFLKNMVKKPVENSVAPQDNPTSVAEKLNENASLLQTLKDQQNQRLLKKSNATIPDGESKIASSLTTNFKELISMVAPKDVVSGEGLLKAIGAGRADRQDKNAAEQVTGISMMVDREELAVDDEQKIDISNTTNMQT